jgi:hypothetical protein
MRNRTWDYYLCDDGGCNTIESQEILLPIGTIFRHEYGFYKVSGYLNDKGEDETRYSFITKIDCDKDYEKSRKIIS